MITAGLLPLDIAIQDLSANGDSKQQAKLNPNVKKNEILKNEYEKKRKRGQNAPFQCSNPFLNCNPTKKKCIPLSSHGDVE